MRPSSIGGGRILRRTLSVCPSVPLSLPSVTWRHLANYNDTHVLCGTRRGPHIVRPSRPHKLVFILPMLSVIQYLRMFLANFFHYVIGADRAQCECPQIFSGPLEARTRDKMHDAPLHERKICRVHDGACW